MPTGFEHRRRARRLGRQMERIVLRISSLTFVSLLVVRAVATVAVGGVAESAQAEPLTQQSNLAWRDPPTSQPHDHLTVPQLDSTSNQLAGLMEVIGTQGKGLRIRREADGRAPTVGAVDEGIVMQVVEGPAVDGDGTHWYRVAGYGLTAVTGWANGAFLQPTEDTELAPVGVTLSAKLTAYTYQEPVGGAHGWITRSGTVVRPGVVAVDPRVIPLGSRLLIEGFDRVYIAEDTGFGVIGPHLDLFFPTEEAALHFGVQYGRVTVLN